MDLEYGHFEAIAIVTDSGIHKAKTSSWESDKSEKVTRHVLITGGRVGPPQRHVLITEGRVGPPQRLQEIPQPLTDTTIHECSSLI